MTVNGSIDLRPATSKDLPEVFRIMKELGEVNPRVDYKDIDGDIFVDSTGGAIKGYIWIRKGKPETIIRSIGVDPKFQGDGEVKFRLLGLAVKISKEFGSELLEGFSKKTDKASEWSGRGWVITPGMRMRLYFDNKHPTTSRYVDHLEIGHNKPDVSPHLNALRPQSPSVPSIKPPVQ